jgi:hypothetical protein
MKVLASNKESEENVIVSDSNPSTCFGLITYIHCSENRLKIAKIVRNRDFFKKMIFSKKIAEKIDRFFGDFFEQIAKNSRVDGKKSLSKKMKNPCGFKGP